MCKLDYAQKVSDPKIADCDSVRPFTRVTSVCTSVRGTLGTVTLTDKSVTADKLERVAFHKKITFERYIIKNLNFHPLEVVSRCRDTQLQVGEN